jgi:hypothetical protein
MQLDARRRFVLLAVLLCLQSAAAVLAVRRDPGERFRAACVSGLVWVALRKIREETPRSSAVRPRFQGRTD